VKKKNGERHSCHTSFLFSKKNMSKAEARAAKAAKRDATKAARKAAKAAKKQAKTAKKSGDDGKVKREKRMRRLASLSSAPSVSPPRALHSPCPRPTWKSCALRWRPRPS